MGKVKEILAIVLGVLPALPATLAAQPCPPVEIRNVEGNYIVPGSWAEIVYREVGGEELALDAYVQQGGETRPAVLVLHGGGWTHGSRVTYISQFLEMLAKAGFNWFSIDYRLAPRHPLPAALEDVRAALQFVRCNAARFRIDPERIALLGDDAGGHLAALLATARPAGVQAVVTLGSPFDLRKLGQLREPETATRLFGPLSGPALEERLEQLSPAARVNPEMPPVLAVFGTADPEIPARQPQEFCGAVWKAGGRCDLLAVEGGIHLPENWPPRLWGYKKEILEWLAERLELEQGPGVPYQTRLRKDLVYGTYRDREGVERPLHLDSYRPAGPGPFPAVILVHGGGWEAGSKVTYLTPLLEPLARAGFAWFSIDYRLTPEFQHPVQLEDLRRAIRFVRHHAPQFQVDPHRIALLGESAGGQMVVQVAAEPCPPKADSSDPVDQESCESAAVVSFYGVYDFLSMVRNASPGSLLVRLFGRSRLDEEAQALLRRYSPLYEVRPDMAPILLIHGTAKRLWEQAQRFQQALRQAGIPHELYPLEGAPHGMENWEGHPQWAGYKDHLVKWLHRILDPASSR